MYSKLLNVLKMYTLIYIVINAESDERLPLTLYAETVNGTHFLSQLSFGYSFHIATMNELNVVVTRSIKNVRVIKDIMISPKTLLDNVKIALRTKNATLKVNYQCTAATEFITCIADVSKNYDIVMTVLYTAHISKMLSSYCDIRITKLANGTEFNESLAATGALVFPKYEQTYKMLSKLHNRFNKQSYAQEMDVRFIATEGRTVNISCEVRSKVPIRYKVLFEVEKKWPPAFVRGNEEPCITINDFNNRSIVAIATTTNVTLRKKHTELICSIESALGWKARYISEINKFTNTTVRKTGLPMVLISVSRPWPYGERPMKKPECPAFGSQQKSDTIPFMFTCLTVMSVITVISIIAYCQRRMNISCVMIC
nr:membrane protein b148 [Mastomys natalensis cytomegalovirus 3]WEG69964.1 membrane protein b148 [Mastomys natalensis cytomegalovirus 3]WEG70104.1 membrane protein b148 [Mastomys natalensis cytomegalovirus 3]WEG70244.1 membrane protein b148 [Mastomys natalensis cytomegalovirus 3]WEG70384.1 membrane protein b148 [Mastomys natalensis cytomegalovirus 3]